MKVTEFYEKMCADLPKEMSCPWDKDGFEVCPGSSSEVKRVLVALDVTGDVIDKAIDEDFDVIMSHHPIFWNGIGRLSDDDFDGARAIKLIKNDISVMSFHTRLDAQAGGVNDILASLLGLRNVTVMEKEDERIMRVGELDREMTPDEFCKLVKEKLCVGAVALSPCGKNVKRVAVLGGGGGGDIGLAVASGADTYLTGELKHSQLMSAAELGINLVMAWHYDTEFPACRRLCELAERNCPDAYVEVFDCNKVIVG